MHLSKKYEDDREISRTVGKWIAKEAYEKGIDEGKVDGLANAVKLYMERTKSSLENTMDCLGLSGKRRQEVIDELERREQETKQFIQRMAEMHYSKSYVVENENEFDFEHSIGVYIAKEAYKDGFVKGMAKIAANYMRRTGSSIEDAMDYIDTPQNIREMMADIIVQYSDPQQGGI